MRKAGFLSKLKEEGRIQLVEPSEEVKEAYFRKSESYLASAKLLLENDRIEESVSMAYYSMYYSTLALFFKVGIKCENHTAAIILTSEIFNIENTELSHAKKERIDKQYYLDFSITREDSALLIKKAEKFNTRILDYTTRLNSDDIEHYRKKLRQIT